MSRFTDDYPFFGSPRKTPPATLNILLAGLNVSFASLDEQRAAVAGWLEENEPGPRLAAELAERHLLAETR